MPSIPFTVTRVIHPGGVYLPEKYENFVSWDYDIPNMIGKIIHSCSKPPTSIFSVLEVATQEQIPWVLSQHVRDMGTHPPIPLRLVLLPRRPPSP